MAITWRSFPRADPALGGREKRASAPAGVRSRAGLDGFFEQAFDLHCVARPDGYVERLNGAWAASLGWTTDQLCSRPFLSFVHPEDRRRSLVEMGRLARRGESLGFENRIIHTDGSFRYLEWNARFLSDRGRVYATARDITVRKRLEGEVLEIAEREQRRLARELHDGLGQTLAGIAALSASLARRLQRADASNGSSGVEDGVSEASAEITRLLNGAIVEARGLAHGLSPVGLERTGLRGALLEAASNLERWFGVACDVDCDPCYGIPPAVEAHLLRIVQEAVGNAVAHGRARRIEIGLHRQNGHGVLTIRDDGIGLPAASAPTRGMGLRSMAFRAGRIGGRIEVRRGAKAGSVVACTFPVSPGRAHRPRSQDPDQDQ